MQDSIKKIRLEIAYDGLEYMLASEKELSRKDIFVTKRPPLDEAKKAKIFKEIMNKAWQVSCLDRLIKENILKKTGTTYQTKYVVADRDVLRSILQDFKNNGTMLAYFLFPSEVSRPPLSEMALGSSKEIVPVDAEEIAQTDDDVLDVASLVTLLKAVVNGVVDLKNTQDTYIRNVLDTFENLLIPYKELVIESHKSVISAIIPHLTQLEQNNKSINKRLSENESTSKAVLKVTENVQASLKKLGNIEELLKTVSEADKNTKRLQESVDELTTIIKAREQSKLTDIAAALKRNAAESEQLQQLILDAVAAASS